MSVLEYHHKELVSFLKEVRDTTPEFSFIAPKSEERKLFNFIIDSEDGPSKQVKAADTIGVNAPHLRKKVQPHLNKLLKSFSDRCGIKPPIQLFFNTAGDYPGGHFACCKVEDNASKSNDFIRSEDLQNLLGNARQVLRLGPVVVKYNASNEQQANPVEAHIDINSEMNQLEDNSSNNFNCERPQNMENQAINQLYMKLLNEAKEVEKAMINAYDKESADMFRKMWDLKQKQIRELEFKMNKFNVNDLPPNQLKKLRKELGLSEE